MVLSKFCDCMTMPPVDLRTHWISPKDQYQWLKSPYLAVLELAFPQILANIISQYANYNLGKNRSNWYKALINLGLLPDRIPPLPLNIHEILDRDCPLHPNSPNLDGTYKKIQDTHFLCLLPAGQIDTLAKRKFGVQHRSPYLSDVHYGPGLHDPELALFNNPEWVLISNVLLPASTNANYECQTLMIETLRKSTDIDYEIPSFKHALGANLLHAAAEKRSLWGESLSTRVEETFRWNFKSVKEWWNASVNWENRNLTIVDPYSLDSMEIGVHNAPCSLLSHQVGIAVIWRITKPSFNSAEACSIS